MADNFLLTGEPGVGKTTLLRLILKRLGALALTGFFTEEIREGGKRVGFRVETCNGNSAVMAHRKFRTDQQHRVGPYGVHTAAFEKLISGHLDGTGKCADLVVVDEIGKMEMFSELFKKQLVAALESECPLLGTIALQGTGLIKRIKQRPDVNLFTVTHRNRDVLSEEILRRIRPCIERRKGVADRPAGDPKASVRVR